MKNCSECMTSNRAFANFCRTCGTAFANADGNWIGYKGNEQRLGLNAKSLPGWQRSNRVRLEIVGTPLSLRLGDSCRSLLGYDGHVIAVSQNGTIEIGEPQSEAAAWRFQNHGPISCEPCIDRGVLYVGSRGHLTAYSLGAATLSTPRLRSLWQIPLAGTPIQALAVVGEALFLTVVDAGRKDIHIVDELNTATPAARSIYSASRLSWLAGDPHNQRVVFFSEEDDRGLQLHTIEAKTGEVTSQPVSMQSISEQPIALAGGKAFGIFGDQQRLYRIDIRTGAVEEPLGIDTQLFSLSLDRDRDWDHDGVSVDSSGVVFARSGTRDSLTHLDRAVKGSPLIVQGCAAVVGLQDGRILLYDLARVPRHFVWRLESDGDAPITALASFGQYVAAGNAKGVVEIRELRAVACSS